MNYAEANAQLTGRCFQSRKLANNTYLRRRYQHAIAVRLHSTDILRFQKDGRVADRGQHTKMLPSILPNWGQDSLAQLSEYVRYYHQDRTHLGLAKQTPASRARSIASGDVISHARLGGLHHRYERTAA